MRQSTLFCKTLKDAPREAQAVSHKLLLRGGFIEQIASGRYAFLPLGMLVWEKIVKIIDDKIRQIGSQRILTPTLHPIEIWRQTNRDSAFGDEMIIIEDHHGSTFALGATAEGLMTELIGDSKPSYKNLPIIVHQFVQKFRDEKRPRGGLLRVREFMMKDAYSFHASEDDLLVWYKKFYKAYEEIAEAFDLKVTPVIADSGAIGGDYNHEFMVDAETGEDTILVCNKCDYAANLEKAESEIERPKQDKELKPKKDIEGKGIIGVEALATYLKIPIEVTTKTLLYETSDERVIATMVRGDYDINEVKLKKVLGVDHVELASKEVVKRTTGAEVGYAGPINLPDEVTVLVDLSCKDRTNFEVGANKTDYHSINVNFERDLKTSEFVDIRAVKAGDKCINCSGILKEKRTIEWAHIFHQGQFYSKPHKATYTDESGKNKTLWQGAYGIGVGRTMATIVETHFDEKGIIWPKLVTPFHVHIINLKKDIAESQKLYEACKKEGYDALLDDRDIRAGEKFAESDLLGISIRLVVGDKNQRKIEWKERASNEVKVLSIEQTLKMLEAFYK